MRTRNNQTTMTSVEATHRHSAATTALALFVVTVFGFVLTVPVIGQVQNLLSSVNLANTVLSSPPPPGAQEELPGLGHKFELIGAMMQDADPENPVGKTGGSGGGVGGNEAISATMTPTTVALALRRLPPGIKIAALDNQLGLKYFFVGTRTCGAGSPRMTLLVDSDGDGDFDFAAHGHVNAPMMFAGCPSNKWVYENLTDDLPRWEVTGSTGPLMLPLLYNTWEILEQAVMTTFPNHRVYSGFLVEDSCSFAPTTCGKAYYDLVTIENRTLEIWQDTVRNP
jgi:hypothetical protein